MNVRRATCRAVVTMICLGRVTLESGEFMQVGRVTHLDKRTIIFGFFSTGFESNRSATERLEPRASRTHGST